MLTISLVVCLPLFTDGFSQSADLRFRDDGSFRIAQITDTHYKGAKEDEVKIESIEKMLDDEKPDIVIYTGDFVNSDEVSVLDRLFEPCIKRKIPWAAVLGNHDDEHAFTREKLMHYLVAKPYCIAEIGPDIGGYGNYTLEIRKTGETQPAFVLYCIDNAYQPEGFSAKGWVSFEQIAWYRSKSAAYKNANGGTPVPAAAFFHIPLDEYVWVQAHQTEAKMLGDRGEVECLGVLNSGLFQAFWEGKDILATFCGHDHSNNYAGMYHGIALIYGHSTCHRKPRGSRMIEIYSDGRRSLKTWVWLLDGKRIYETVTPVL